MATKCGACDEKVLNISYMECSNENCKKLFHVKCLALTLEVFEAFSEEYKSTWICPECICCNPKHNNQDTPVRGNTPTLNRTFTNNVNTRRGNRSESSTTNTEIGTDMIAELLNEMRIFRLDVMKRLDTQAESIQKLQVIAEETKTKVETLFLNKKVGGENSRDTVVITNKIEELKKVQNVTLHETEKQLKTFAEILSQKTTNDTASTNPVINEVGATKSPIFAPTVNLVATENKEEKDIQKKEETGNEDNNWKVVKNRKTARRSSDVKKGQNATNTTIKATERKKHLHVWRLHSETSSEALENYLKNICDAEVAVEKITHKAKRDYASFRISVPESAYNTICQPDVWPINTEFTEWIWFRKSTNRQTM